MKQKDSIILLQCINLTVTLKNCHEKFIVNKNKVY